ncbi:TetR family transcriptional regulator [Aldersonia sp. NBC_00410]|uniref:TetR family transcriptional regulator n=1 Tax=Aldersonia sp. NBC_00410 TaxID=2975954 RepID=UPI0022582AB6|nr:TetR family transcriptional regulator [Aldersonia sp. NBC_00410]MCX5045442.1 TetR family transcriptional regulator [Aldersonia sp. NBC_00410]
MESALGSSEQRIRASVLELLEVEGYEAIQVREVARQAKVSLTKIYKLYGTRDELILAALDWWMAEHCYGDLPEHPVRPGESLHVALMRVLRPIFEPWERNPRLLAAYFRARASAEGARLVDHGIDAVFPAAMAVLEGVDLDFINDLYAILSSLIYGLMGRFAAGEIAATDILPAIDRTMFWLASGYQATHAS